MSLRPRVYRPSILIYRDGLIARDYGASCKTTDEYGTALLAAITALTANDTLVIGPGIYTCVNATVAASNVKIYAAGAEIRKKSATNYTHLLKVDGDDVLIDGLTLNGTGVANTGTGFGFHVTGDRLQLHNCAANGTLGTTASSGHGTACYLYQCADTLIHNYSSYNAGYAAIWMNGTVRTYINGAMVIDSNNRSLSITGAVDMDLIRIENFHAIAVTEGCSVLWNTNITDGYTLKELRVSNTDLTDTDMVSSGVSYNDADGHQMFKFQNMGKVVMDNVTLNHGTNSGAGAERSMYIQDFDLNTAPDELIMTNCSLADAFVCGLKIPYFVATNCRFGYRKLATAYNELFYFLRADYAKFDNCHFFQEAKPQCFEMGSDVANTDRYLFRSCRFESNSGSSTYIMNQSDDVDLTTLAGCFVFDETNSLDNVGAGTMYKTNNEFGDLILSTDANGDMLWDDTLVGTGAGKHPDDGGSSPYFTGLTAGRAGLKIWNKNWETGDADGDNNESPVKCWKSNGTSWLSYLS